MIFKREFRFEGIFKGRVEEYFQVVANISKWDRWNPNVHYMILDTPFRKGATGRSIPTQFTPTNFEITEVIHNERIVIRFKLAIGSMTIDYNFEREDDDSTFIRRISTARGITAFLIYTMNSKRIDKEFGETLQCLESQVEFEKFDRAAKSRAIDTTAG